MKDFKFDYGVIEYKHRFSINRSLDDYKLTCLNKCIRIGLQLCYKTMACDKLVYEMQIIYRDENNECQLLRLDLHDYTFKIKHVGNMQVDI